MLMVMPLVPWKIQMRGGTTGRTMVECVGKFSLFDHVTVNNLLITRLLIIMFGLCAI